MLNEDQKNRKLNDLLDALDFNQVCGGGGSHGNRGVQWSWGHNAFHKILAGAGAHGEAPARPF